MSSKVEPLASNDVLAGVVADRESVGAIRCDSMLGFTKMPRGYALMLNSDKTHFYWLRYDGKESSINWDKWAIYRGARIVAAKESCMSDEKLLAEYNEVLAQADAGFAAANPLTYDAGKQVFKHGDLEYDAETVQVMIDALKRLNEGSRPQFACNRPAQGEAR